MKKNVPEAEAGEAAADEAARPEEEASAGPQVDMPQAEAPEPPPEEEHMEEQLERAPTPPRAATPPAQPEAAAGAASAPSAPEASREDIPPSPPSARMEEATATGQTSSAPEATEEVPPERGDTEAQGTGAEAEDLPPSPQAHAEASSSKLDTGAGPSAPRKASQALSLSGWDWSRGRRDVAFRLVRESLEGLEAHLALEDGKLTQQRDELAGAWAALHAAVEARRQSDQARMQEHHNQQTEGRGYAPLVGTSKTTHGPCDQFWASKYKASSKWKFSRGRQKCLGAGAPAL